MKFVLFFLIAMLPLSAGDRKVRIGIFSKFKLQELSLNLSRGRIFHNGKDSGLTEGVWKLKIHKNKLELKYRNIYFRGNHLLIVPEGIFSLSFHSGKNGISRRYSGSLEFSIKQGSILPVLTIPVDSYSISSALAELGELLSVDEFWKGRTGEIRKKELIAAQEILIRSYITAEKERHPGMPYDFCDLTHCVHFPGTADTAPLREGIVLKGDKIIPGYFHSACGGNLAGPDSFWKEISHSDNFRTGKDGDDSGIYCSGSPHNAWESHFSPAQLTKIIGEDFTDTPSVLLKDGRVNAVEYRNELKIKKQIPVSLFFSRAGKLFGWNKIKSNDFTITGEGQVFIFRGKGLGHGIGLCQWGAAKQAASGKTFREILEFYFPGSRLEKY